MKELKTLNLNERATTWNSIGTDVTGLTRLEDVMREANLDYEVEKKPITVEGTNFIVPGKMATVRKSDGKVFGCVSENYHIVQNAEAFDFINYINSDIDYVKAGMTKGGMVYIIGKLPEQFILGDGFTPYVIFRNSFNGRYNVQSAICPLRIVCQNQFTTAFKNSDNTVAIRHSRNADTKMSEAQEVLRHTAEHMNTLNEFAEKMAMEKVGKLQVDNLVEAMFEVVEEDMTKRKISNLTADKESFLTAYNAPDNANFIGTKWGLINAYTDFLSHKPIQRMTDTAVEKRFESVSFDPEAMTTFYQRIREMA